MTDTETKVANAIEGTPAISGGPIIDGIFNMLVAKVEAQLPAILDALYAAATAALQKWLASKV